MYAPRFTPYCILALPLVLLAVGCPPSQPAGIGLSDTSHDFGATGTEWDFEVWNTGSAGTSIDFQLALNHPALHCDATGGTSTGPDDRRTVHVTLDRAELPAGETLMSVVVSAPGVDSRTIQVRAVRPAGSLSVAIEPEPVRAVGGQWRVDGGAWRSSGYVAERLLPGAHQVSFKEVAGWTRPQDLNVSVIADQTTQATGTYVQQTVDTGWLRVTIEPEAARSSGAMWNVDGGTWQSGGATVAGLTPGAHTVAFKALAGWTEPAARDVAIVANETAEDSGTYTRQTGALKVNLSPEGAREAGAQWRVDGGAWQNSSETVEGLTAGQHALSFKEVSGWTRPDSRMVSIAGGQTTEINESYAALNAGYVVFGYNDLGMHCMNRDFSELMVLPPYNTLHALVIDKTDEEPRIVKSGVSIRYEIPGNTTSSDKTNFWDYVDQLLGVALPLDMGLAGNGLAGSMASMAAEGRNDWAALGIPVTPINDLGEEDPYPLATITVMAGGQAVAQTQAVVPVSWEISCDLCHNTPGITPDTDILRAHDRLHPGLNLESQKPVFCGQCHAQAPLGTTGQPDVPSLSRAMHHAHATRMAEAGLNVNCYACHPGIRTQCLRDVHYLEGMDCMDCHGTMSDVADPSRRPWQDEPRCDDCHERTGYHFEQPGTLYRNSKGHRGVHCAACHGSPHAITPTVTEGDNLQAVALQGHAGTIDTCSVCHNEPPDDPFPHRIDDDGDDDDDK